MKTISLTFILIFTSSILAQNFWQPLNGPHGSTYVKQISISPNGQLFLSTLGSGIYRSSDNGNSWVQKVNGFPTPIYDDGTVQFAFNTQGHIYATSFTNGIWRSTNNGDSWSQTSLINGFITAIGINESGFIFAGQGGGGGIYRSTDNGYTWGLINSGLPQPFQVYSILTKSGGLLFAGGGSFFGQCLFKSTNNGGNWQNTGLAAYTINSIVSNINDDIYAGTGSTGVYRSTNNGNNWSAVNSGLTCLRINQVSCNFQGYVFAATDSGLFRSTNNGSSWQQIGFNNKYISTVLALPNGSYFAGLNREGIFRSSNNGTNWIELSNGINALACYSAALNQSGHIFVTIENRRMQRTTDNGNSWQELQNGVSGESYGRVACAPNNYLFASGDSGIFRSTDNGNNWTKVFSIFRLFNDFVFRQNGQIFACSSYPGFGVWTSTNNGLNWVSTDPAFMASVYSLAINSSGYLFAGTAGGGVYRSTNSGVNWIHFGPSGSVRALTCGFNSNVFAAIENSSQGDGIYRSTDNGITWLYTGLELNWVSSMKTNSSGHIYASSLLTGVYRTTDNGISWVHLTSGMFNNMVWDLAFNSQGYLYACTLGNSVYRTVNPTIGIQQISSQVPNAFFLSQNYPNPFNPATNIEFAIPEESSLKLIVYDILGREVETLADEKLKAGTYKVDWNASKYPSGVYFYKLQTESFTKTRKMIFVK